MALIDNIDGVAKVERELTDLNNRLGKSDISGIGNGTVTGALCEVNEKIENAIVQTTSPTLANSVAGGLKVVEVQGNTAQETTTGAQLFDANTLSVQAGATRSTNGDTLTTSGKNAYSGVTYTLPNPSLYIGQNLCLSYENVSNDNQNANPELQAVIMLADGSKTYKVVSKGTKKNTFSIPNDAQSIVVQIVVNNSNTSLDTAATVKYKGIMLNVGNDRVSWEPYTGAKASPNPDYPQEIKCANVGEIKTTGKNLLKHRYDGETKNGVTFTKNADNSVTVNGTATAKTDYLLGTKNTTLADLPNGKYILSGCPSGGSVNTYRLLCWNYDGTNVSANDVGNGVTFDKTNTQSDYNIGISIASGVTVNNLVFKPMLRSVEIADATYKPYQESIIALSNPITLNAIGDAKDRIIKKDGLWQIERNIGEVVFDGSSDEGWLTGNTTNTSGKYRNQTKYLVGVIKNGDTAKVSNIVCDRYIAITSNTSGTFGCKDGISVNNDGGIFIYDENENTNNASSWKAYLIENPITVKFELATTTYETLPVADQIALNSLQAFDGATYVNADCEIDPIIEVEYGTSKAGAYSLEAYNIAQRNSILIAEINKAIPYAISIDDAASTINFEDRSAV